VLRLSLYALIGGLTSIDRERLMASFSARAPVRAAAGLLVALAAVFSLLWLSTIVTGMLSGDTPRELRDTGLATNPVHVLDLAASCRRRCSPAWRIETGVRRATRWRRSC
jgi:hypothetical protein